MEPELGAISGDQPREIEMALSFLDGNTRYLATIYRDGDAANWKSDPYDYVIEKLTLTSEDTLALKLAAGGGAAIRLQPEN